MQRGKYQFNDDDPMSNEILQQSLKIDYDIKNKFKFNMKPANEEIQ
jgi:hypothetical protein